MPFQSFTFYIVSDQSHLIETLNEYFIKTTGLEMLGYNSNSFQALEDITYLCPDITFLDIDMCHLNRAQFIRMANTKTRMVFITTFANHAADAYDNNIMDYILKPVSYDRFLQCILKLREQINKNEKLIKKEPDIVNYFFIQCELKSRLIKINYHEISYIESLKNYVIIYHKTEKYICYTTMKDIFSYLPMGQFSRIHKSFIINDYKIKSIEGNQVLLENLISPLPIGITFKKTFFDKIYKNILTRQQC